MTTIDKTLLGLLFLCVFREITINFRKFPEFPNTQPHWSNWWYIGTGTAGGTGYRYHYTALLQVTSYYRKLPQYLLSSIYLLCILISLHNTFYTVHTKA